MDKLILYLIIAAGSVAVIWGAVAFHDHGVAVAALAPYQPIIKLCKDNSLDPAGCAKAWDVLKTANTQIAAERLACDNKVTELGKDTAAKLKSTATQLVVANKKIASLETEKASLESSLHRPIAGETCEITLGKINGSNTAIGMRRLRDYGPSANVNAPASASPGAPTVRITQ